MKWLSYIFSVLTLVGCSSLLPTSESIPNTPWTTFEEVKTLYDSVTPGETTLTQLHQLKVNPYKVHNITVLSYNDIRTRFIHNSAITLDSLDNNIQQCFEDKHSCYAYNLELDIIYSKRIGNAFLDVMRFKRITQLDGWHFSCLFVVNKINGVDTIVYKTWNGSPNNRVIDTDTNPLGPLNTKDVKKAVGWKE